ncbi:hypothetical protein ACF08M_01705 [Streptomyces sp. NPDC015032]
MTLPVRVSVYEEDGTPRILDGPEDGSDMAGAEVCRPEPRGGGVLVR